LGPHPPLLGGEPEHLPYGPSKIAALANGLDMASRALVSAKIVDPHAHLLRALRGELIPWAFSRPA
jgi:hypothetical protein